MTRNYRTNQRKVIFEFLVANDRKHFTAEEAFLTINKRGHEVGRATIYRYLDKLSNEGALRKYVPIDGGGAVYEYCGCGGKHFHLKCDVCGELLHLECTDVSNFYRHISKDHDFEIDPGRTVFYGTCGKCKGGGKGGKGNRQ